MTATSAVDPWVAVDHPEILSVPVVERVVTDDGTDYEVTLAFHPRDHVEAMIDALERHLGRTWSDRLPKNTPERAAALRWIETDPAVVQAFTFTMAGGMAEDVAHELDEASLAPEHCRHCDRYGEADTDDGWLCTPHAASLDDYQGHDRDDWDQEA